VDENKREEFYVQTKKIIPRIDMDSLYPDTAGIRPKLQGTGEGFRDFIIKEESDKGLKNFINLIGIESPGLTASAAIGEMIRSLIVI
jgi:L-2-hydroxyglutarate oxidase LhgO